MVVFLFRSLFVSFYVILSSFISHIARYVPSSTYKSTYERRTKINSTYFLERPYSKKPSGLFLVSSAQPFDVFAYYVYARLIMPSLRNDDIGITL